MKPMFSLKGMMLQERPSPYGLDETVEMIRQNAQAIDWVVSGVKEMHHSVKKHGGPDILPVMLVELCKASFAGRILLDDAARYASVMMPCTISAYTKADGRTYVTNIRAGLMGTLMGGTVAEVMNEVAEEQAKILEFLAAGEPAPVAASTLDSPDNL